MLARTVALRAANVLHRLLCWELLRNEQTQSMNITWYFHKQMHWGFGLDADSNSVCHADNRLHASRLFWYPSLFQCVLFLVSLHNGKVSAAISWFWMDFHWTGTCMNFGLPVDGATTPVAPQELAKSTWGYIINGCSRQGFTTSVIMLRYSNSCNAISLCTFWPPDSTSWSQCSINLNLHLSSVTKCPKPARLCDRARAT